MYRTDQKAQAPMQLIRLVHPRHFDKNKNRFQSIAFQPSTANGGISVFCPSCAMETSGKYCQHIRNYYADISGIPSIFWLFDTSILPSNHVIEESLSSTNDHCHRDIKNITVKDSRNIFKTHATYPDSFMICKKNNDHCTLTSTEFG